MGKPDSFPAPPKATRHCRRYSFAGDILAAHGGPRCAAGVDLSVKGAWRACVPAPVIPCALRAEYTEAERAAWQAWVADRIDRLRAAVPLIPKQGLHGTFACPNCAAGIVRWSRAMVNGHVRMACSTPGCCAMMQ